MLRVHCCYTGFTVLHCILQFFDFQMDLPSDFKTNPSSTHYSVKYFNVEAETQEVDGETCQFCSSVLRSEPFIKCQDCFERLCLKCFAKGTETTQHRNYHSYSIQRDDNICVFDGSNWTGQEEKSLLQAILLHGNCWDEVGKTVSSRTAVECEQHYREYYFDGIFEQRLGLTDKNAYFPIRFPFELQSQSLDPPRTDVEFANFKQNGGYRFARGDFDQPFDPTAESMVSNLDLLDPDLEELNLAVFKAYNNRLRYKVDV